MPRNYRNPGAMDMAGYLASQGIRLTGSSHASSVEVLPGFVGSRIGLWRSAARRSVLAHIMQLWPGERGALMQAMLIGGRAFFGRDIKTEFQRTGTYHILVVSGINVGILAFAVFWALRKLPFGETWATILTILLSWGYAFLADLGSPIVRATITLGIYLVTRLLFRERAALNGLGIAALGHLAGESADPVRSQLPAHIPLRDRRCGNRGAHSAKNRVPIPQGAQQPRFACVRFRVSDPGCAISFRRSTGSRPD